MQHLVQEKRHPQAYMAAPQVQAVELHRLCGNAAERSLCLDVATRGGAECNTDHHLVVMKLQLERSSGGTGRKGVKTRKFDVTRLKEGCGDEEESMKERYLQEVLQRAGDSWCESAGVEDKWSAVKTALTNAAEEVLGKADRLQPDWFQESIAQLQPLLAARNAAYAKWLGTKSVMDLSRFRQARNDARRAIRKAKNDWFQDKASEVETESFGGKVWMAIRDMQRGRKGLLPRRNAVIQDEMGEPCNDKNTQQQRWRRHFTKVFNIRSQFKEEVLESMQQREADESLADKPTVREVRKALTKLKNGKAAGHSDILPEMLKAGAENEDCVSMLQTCWVQCGRKDVCRKSGSMLS